MVVSADDFGLCREVNSAICHLYDRGVVAQTSLLTNTREFEASIALLRARPALRVGVHLNLTDGPPVCAPETVASLLSPAGEFIGGRHLAVVARVMSGLARRSEIRAEWRAQVTRAVEAGIVVRHLDGHGHLHLLPVLHEIVAELMEEFGIERVRVVLHDRSLRGRILGPLSRRLLSVLRGSGLEVRYPNRVLGLAATGRLGSDDLRAELEQPWEGEAELITHPSMGIGHAHRAWQFRGDRETEALLEPDVIDRIRALASPRGAA